jgi:hypothetical protein
LQIRDKEIEITSLEKKSKECKNTLNNQDNSLNDKATKHLVILKSIEDIEGSLVKRDRLIRANKNGEKKELVEIGEEEAIKEARKD